MQERQRYKKREKLMKKKVCGKNGYINRKQKDREREMTRENIHKK